MKAISAIFVGAIVSSLCLVATTSHPAASAFPRDDESIVHVLNRVAFGPAAGDVDRVRQIGVERYIDLQLHRERIPDAALQARLAALTTTAMSSRAIAEEYEVPALQARRERQQQAKQGEDA